MDKETIEKILKDTEIGYDSMAEKFSQTRKFFWRGMEFIGDYIKNGDRILDFGCGNGRLLELFPDKKIEYVGVDVSQKLLDLAKNLHPEENVSFLKINPSQVTLPFPDNYFNVVYSIAVFHHFPAAHAAKTARELCRVTKSGGYIVATAWNLWPASARGDRLSTQGGQKNYLPNILQNWWGKLKGESMLGWNDCYINFKNNKGEIFPRYHHAYTKRELKNIFIHAGFQVEKCEIVGGRNIVWIGSKG